MQVSEIDSLPYYEYEYTISIYNDIIKERNDKENQNQSNERDKYNINGLKGNANKQLKGFKQPKLPSIKVPKI